MIATRRWLALLVSPVLTLTFMGQAQGTGFTHDRKTLGLASGSNISWRTPTEHGLAVEVTPHPAWPRLDGAAWIWRTPTDVNEVVTFRRRFRIPHSAQEVRGSLWITADNAYRAYLNGHLVGHNGAFSFDGPDSFTWSTIYRHRLNPKTGLNRLQIKALNYFGPAEPPDNPAGVVFELRVSFECPGKSCSHS
jgi:hypothetical protein